MELGGFARSIFHALRCSSVGSRARESIRLDQELYLSKINQTPVI